MDNQEQNSVYYCCVAKRNKVLYMYSREDQQLESIAALSLEKAPPLHIWYIETVGKHTFGFLSENEFTYFAIVDKNLPNAKLLRFLRHMRDEFNKASKRKLRNSFSFSGRSHHLQEELVPAIKRLIASLDNISQLEQQQQDANGASDPCSSTKAPLLGKPTRHEKKKMKERTSEGRGTSSAEENRSVKIDVNSDEAAANQSVASSLSLQKSLSGGRVRGQQLARRVWWRHVWIVLTVDVVVCLVLFGVWWGVCRGFRCLASS